jgi:hypothetical protein
MFSADYRNWCISILIEWACSRRIKSYRWGFASCFEMSLNCVGTSGSLAKRPTQRAPCPFIRYEFFLGHPRDDCQCGHEACYGSAHSYFLHPCCFYCLDSTLTLCDKQSFLCWSTSCEMHIGTMSVLVQCPCDKQFCEKGKEKLYISGCCSSIYVETTSRIVNKLRQGWY